MDPAAPDLPDGRQLLDEILHRPSWMARAACRGKSPEMFFTRRGQSIEPARAVCAGCPVADECLDFALGSYSEHGVPVMGIWGGASERQRRQMRSARRLDKAG